MHPDHTYIASRAKSRRKALVGLARHRQPRTGPTDRGRRGLVTARKSAVRRNLRRGDLIEAALTDNPEHELDNITKLCGQSGSHRGGHQTASPVPQQGRPRGRERRDLDCGATSFRTSTTSTRHGCKSSNAPTTSLGRGADAAQTLRTCVNALPDDSPLAAYEARLTGTISPMRCRH